MKVNEMSLWKRINAIPREEIPAPDYPELPEGFWWNHTPTLNFWFINKGARWRTARNTSPSHYTTETCCVEISYLDGKWFAWLVPVELCRKGLFGMDGQQDITHYQTFDSLEQAARVMLPLWRLAGER